MPLRQGKRLVLPKVLYVKQPDGIFDEELDFRARYNPDVRYGRLGRIMVLSDPFGS